MCLSQAVPEKYSAGSSFLPTEVWSWAYNSLPLKSDFLDFLPQVWLVRVKPTPAASTNLSPNSPCCSSASIIPCRCGPMYTSHSLLLCHRKGQKQLWVRTPLSDSLSLSFHPWKCHPTARMVRVLVLYGGKKWSALVSCLCNVE